ncbi:MAG: hypothetical protein GY830_10375 [Bacteroidetes bacterium]|nr:hypothetical protein [Bacteroidota bacterium]
MSNTKIWELSLIGVFLLFNLILGLYAGKNIKNIKEYALGNKNFGTCSLVFTFLATNIGGFTVIGIIEKTYSFGFIVTILDVYPLD